jgi:tRNA (adenine22-N1)-methyltransferase
MVLGNRLLIVASMIPEGKKVVDVGTDHAYLPIFLIKKGTSPRVIATEIMPGPFSKALVNIKREGLEQHIELRFGSGLKPISLGDAHVAVISGMGGETIIDILKGSKMICDSLDLIILQPMKSQSKLRKYLFLTGYKIVDEAVARETDRFYEVIATVKGRQGSFDTTDLEVGPVLRKKKSAVIVEYIQHRMMKLKKLAEELVHNDSRAAIDALEKYEKKMELLNKVLKQR